VTPLQLANAECANYEHNGACLGVHLGDKGQITHCRPKPRCVLSAGERCAYFEDCVAPMADMVKEPRRAKAIQEAVFSYHMAHPKGTPVQQGRKGGQRGILPSQRPREGIQDAQERGPSQNPYEDSGCLQNDTLTVEAAALAGRGAEA
jgi:hypothetical protein